MSNALLALLSFVNLVIGTGAFVIASIVGDVARDFGTSIASAGQAMTVYALATAVLAPLLLVVTGGWPRKRALLFSLGLFVAGNAASALAPNLPALLAARVVMGAGAAFTPLAAGLVVASVDVASRGRALSIVFLGMSLSYAIGVPLGAWVGLRYGWTVPVHAVTVIGAAAWVALAWRVPADIRAPGASLNGAGALMLQPPVRRTLGLTLLYFTAIFCVFSYIGPVLRALYPPMTDTRLSLTLMCFGLAGVAGTLIGGWANDRFGSLPTLRTQLTLLASTMALVPLTAGSATTSYGAMVAVFVAWGTAGFGMMAPQQSRLAALSPAHAPLLFSLNSTMLYAGTALGAAVGGAALPHTGFAQLAWMGLPFALVSLGLLLFGERRSGRDARAAS
jgi:DHA1 family inner membrane transport protein